MLAEWNSTLGRGRLSGSFRFIWDRLSRDWGWISRRIIAFEPVQRRVHSSRKRFSKCVLGASKSKWRPFRWFGCSGFTCWINIYIYIYIYIDWLIYIFIWLFVRRLCDLWWIFVCCVCVCVCFFYGRIECHCTGCHSFHSCFVFEFVETSVGEAAQDAWLHRKAIDFHWLMTKEIRPTTSSTWAHKNPQKETQNESNPKRKKKEESNEFKKINNDQMQRWFHSLLTVSLPVWASSLCCAGYKDERSFGFRYAVAFAGARWPQSPSSWALFLAFLSVSAVWLFIGRVPK